jgi:hypothetical protein
MEKQSYIRLANGRLEGSITKEQVRQLGLGDGATFRAEVSGASLTLIPTPDPEMEARDAHIDDFMTRYDDVMRRLAQ